jgi:polysaccharide biosynthesis/export protein
LGEAKRPGSYTISGLGTIMSGLYAAGGITSNGSLRNIQLRRQGRTVRTLDLYDVLMRGDTSDDSKVLPGDVIFVPPVGATVSVDGEVRRPAIYEIKNEATVVDLVGLAGGLTPEANRLTASLMRIDEQQHRVVIQVDPTSAAAGSQRLRNGDLLTITRLRPTLDSGVVLQGHVFTPGTVAWREGIRLSDVIHSVDELQPNADIHYLLIRRESPPDRHISVLSADLAAALAGPGTASDVPLMPRDRVTVFDLSTSRDRVIDPLLQELHVQGNMVRPSAIVHVEGLVKVPGDYPLEPDMTISDLIRAGGGLSDAAYGRTAELTRYQVVNGEDRRTQLVNVDLDAAVRGEATANVKLQPFDTLIIKEMPEWGGRESVFLEGEVRFPGRYAIRRGETLRSVIARAGGLTDYSFPEGSVFTREELKKREQEQIDQLANRMQRDLAVLALQGAAANQAGAPAALSVGQTLLGQLRSAKAAGRLVIDLPKAMRAPPGSVDDIILRNGDDLTVPRFRQEVTVIGEVQTNTSHLYRPDLARDDYVSLSGGVTRQADRGRIYIVRANGSVVASEGSRWFQAGGRASIKPGDTIVVPLDTERMPALPFWQAVTGILYNLAIVGLALHSF